MLESAAFNSLNREQCSSLPELSGWIRTQSCGNEMYDVLEYWRHYELYAARHEYYVA